MTQLSKIISSILRDVILAQHQANMYAASLGDAYRRNGRMEKFQLPTVAFGQMELELKYGIKEVLEPTTQTEIDYPKLRRVCNKIATQVSQVIVSEVVMSVTSSDMKLNREALILKQLSTETKLSNRFQSFLSRKIFQAYCSDFANLFNDDGSFNVEQLVYTSLEVAVAEFLNHKEMQGALYDQGQEDLRLIVRSNLEATLTSFMPELTRDTIITRKREYPSLEVEVSSEELSKYPNDCIHSFQFTVQPSYQSLNSLDDELRGEYPNNE